MTKVLLVEDDNNLREIYEARLLSEGYEVITGKDGEDALTLIKQHQPDLLISDVMMPRISGFEMLDILRNTQGIKQPKVIMLTALGQAEDRAHADGIGADMYLVKSQVTLEDIVKAAADLTNPAPQAASTDGNTSATDVGQSQIASENTPELANITIPEPSFSAPGQEAAPEANPVIPEPESVAAVEAPSSIPVAVEAPTVEPESEPVATAEQAQLAEPTAPVASEPKTNDELIASAIETLQTNQAEEQPVFTSVEPGPASDVTEVPSPTMPTADPTPELEQPAAVAPSTSNKIIQPLPSAEGERHINDLLAEHEANEATAAVATDFATQSATVVAAPITPEQPPIEPQIAPISFETEAPVMPVAEQPPVFSAEPTVVQPVAPIPVAPAPEFSPTGTSVVTPNTPDPNSQTPFTPNVGGDANTNAL